MAFENVNVTSLRNALNQCKNSINHSTTDELIESISNTSVWQSSAQNTLKKALTKLDNERYKDLENKIDKYLELVDYIEKYKTLEQENKDLQKQYQNLSSRLYYTQTDTLVTVLADGTEVEEKTTRQVKNTSVEYQMSNINKKINENKEKMENYKNKVSNSI